MNQLILTFKRVTFTLIICTLSVIAQSQNDSVTLTNLNNKKLKLARQVNKLQDSITAINKEINTIESKLKLSKYGTNDVMIEAYLTSNNKIRKRPEPLSEVIGNIATDAKVQLIDYDPTDYWLIKADEMVGFVSSLYVVSNDKIEQLQKTFMERNILKEAEQMKKQKAELLAKKKKQDANQKAADEKRRKNLIAKYGEKNGTRIFNGYYWLGMSDDMAKESLGNPSDINRSVGKWGVHEQWVYGSVYLYFENGILTSYQD